MYDYQERVYINGSLRQQQRRNSKAEEGQRKKRKTLEASRNRGLLFECYGPISMETPNVKTTNGISSQRRRRREMEM